MRFMLPSRFLGTLTAATIALTSLTAVPAYADNNRAARTVATILGIAVVGKIIHDQSKDKREVHKPRAVHKPKVKQHHTNHRRHYTHKNHQRKKHQQYQQRSNRKLLPQHCFRSFQTQRGNVNMFGRQCLERNFRHANSLPHNCAQRIHTYNGPRVGYEPRCLQRNGYRLARG